MGEQLVMIRHVAAGAALLSLLLAGPVSAATQTVTANDDNFSPSSRSVPLGDKVHWDNPSAGSHRHTSTSNSTNPISWNFNMPDGTGLSPTVTFGHSGSFAYHCDVHSSMKGSVSVRMSSTRIDPNSWTVRSASASAPAGFTHAIQYRKKGTTAWINLGSVGTSATRRFDAPSAGIWQLRGRYNKTGGPSSGFSPILTLTTT